jgi:hypothetical protein
MKEIKIVEPFKMDILLEISHLLGKNMINIESLANFNLGDMIVINIYVKDSDYEKALELLEKNYKVIKNEGFFLEMIDTPGELAKFLSLMKDNNITVYYLNVLERYDNISFLIVNTNDNKKAIQVLKENGYNIKT